MNKVNYFFFITLLFCTPVLCANDNVPDEIVIAYWKNCALYLQELQENPPPRSEADILIARMVQMRSLLNRIDWEHVKDPDKFLALLRNGE